MGKRKKPLWFWEELDQVLLPPVSIYSNFWLRRWMGQQGRPYG
jgi:hypothetical protein